MTAPSPPGIEAEDAAPRHPPRRAAMQTAAERWLMRSLPAVIFFCLTSVTLLFWWSDIETHQEDEWHEMQRVTALVARQFATQVERHYLANLRALEHLQQSWQELYQHDERAFLKEAAALQRACPTLGAIGWADADCVLQWTQPPAGGLPPRKTDLKTVPELWMDLRAARASQTSTVSVTRALSGQQISVLLFLPLRDGNRPLGHLIGSLRTPEFIESCLVEQTSKQFHIAVFDAGLPIYQQGEFTEGEFPHSTPVIERRVNIGNRVWAMRLQVGEESFARFEPWGRSFLVWVGLSLSAIMAVMAWMLQARAKRLADQHDLLQESDERLRERVRSLRLLNELGAMLRQTLELKQIYHATLAKVRDAFGFDVLACYRFDPQEQSLRLEAHHGIPDGMLPDMQVQTLGTRLEGRAAQTGELLVVEDLAADPREQRAAIREAGVRFTVYQPVKHLDKVLGLLVLAYRSQRQLQAADLNLLGVIADATAVAVSNAVHFEQVRSSREFFQSLFDSATEAVFVESLDGELLMANPRACQMLGYAADELVGQPSARLFAIEDRQQVVPRADEKLKRDRETLFEANYVTRNGALVPAEISARRVRVGQQDLIITFSRDLAIRRRLEQELLQSRTMESIGTLAGGIAHDFNNQLSGILGFGSLMLSSMKPDDPHYGEVQKMVAAAERAATLVQQLLTLGRKSPPKPRPINLNEVVDQVIHLLRHSLVESVEVRVEKAPSLPAANADPVQWEQVLMNLCLNARDAIFQSRRRGVITVRTLAEDIPAKPNHGAHACPPGRYVTLVVTDNGCGMDAVTRQRLFEPFFTTKRGGRNVGLGLAMVFNTVKSHQGHIEAESEPGVGSTFRIRLPAIEAAVEPPAASNDEAPRGEETVLLVDDDLSVLDLTRVMLERSGYTVLTARDAIEGLDLYKKHRDRIALVITDLIMPKVNGGEFIAQLRAITPTLKAIVSTGYSADAALLTSADHRPQAVIQKPFKMTELAHLTRQVLDGTLPPLNLQPPPASQAPAPR